MTGEGTGNLLIFTPGNYPDECWSLGDGRIGLERTDCNLLLIDIHEFSQFCERFKDDERVSSFVTNFFSRAEGSYFGLGKDFGVNKYIGDAILAIYSLEILEGVIDRSLDLLRKFQSEIEEILGFGMKLCIILDKVVCWKGGVGGNLYFDYSYWGEEVNTLFALTKVKEKIDGVVYKVKEGFVYLTQNLVGSLNLNQRERIDQKYVYYKRKVIYKGKDIYMYQIWGRKI